MSKQSNEKPRTCIRLDWYTNNILTNVLRLSTELGHGNLWHTPYDGCHFILYSYRKRTGQAVRRLYKWRHPERELEVVAGNNIFDGLEMKDSKDLAGRLIVGSSVIVTSVETGRQIVVDKIGLGSNGQNGNYEMERNYPVELKKAKEDEKNND